MNTEFASLYQPAEPWTGRNDGPGHDHARWHSVIRPFDAPSAGPGSVTIVGYASDEGVFRNGGRQGAAAGPAAMRAALGSLAVHEEVTYFDYGTITTQHTDLEQSQDYLSDSIAAITSTGSLAIVLGGGHETSFATHRGAATALGPLAIANLDAHFDLRSGDVDGNPRATSGTPFHQISTWYSHRNSTTTGDDAHQTWDFDYTVAGISQPNNTAILFSEASRLGVRVLTDEHMLDMRPAEAAAKVLALVAEGPLSSPGHAVASPHPAQPASSHPAQPAPTRPGIHLSIDLDVLPASQAPGVSAPATLGVDFSLIRQICLDIAATGRLKLVDIVELNPKFDRDNATARLAARLVNDIARSHQQAVLHG